MTLKKDETKATATAASPPDDDEAELEAMSTISKGLWPNSLSMRDAWRIDGPWMADRLGRHAQAQSSATGPKTFKLLAPATQRRVIEWAAAKYGAIVATAGATKDPVEEAATPKKPRKAVRKNNAGSTSTTAANKPKAKPSHDKDLNLHPPGATSFKDFVEDKAPANNNYEHNVVAVYWLSQIAKTKTITASQVFTCYRDTKWKLPYNLRNSLQLTAHNKGWLDTKDSDDIELKPQGINFVERELPSPKKK